MAFTGSPVDTTVRAAQKADMPIAGDVQGSLYVADVTYTHAAGAGTGEINLVKLPAGRVKVFPRLSRLRSTDMAANADLHLGHRAYTNFDGTAVAEDDDEWIADADAGGGALNDFWASITGATGVEAAEYETRDGLEIFVTIDSGNIEDDDTIDVEVVYSLVA